MEQEKKKGFFETLMNFESQSMQQIAFNMVKWFEFESVEISTKVRDNVESRVWISVKIEHQGKTFYIDGQRNDIVVRRLSEWLTSFLNSKK